MHRSYFEDTPGNRSTQVARPRDSSVFTSSRVFENPKGLNPQSPVASSAASSVFGGEQRLRRRAALRRRATSSSATSRMTDNDSNCAPSSTPGCSSTPNVEEFFVPIDDEIQDEEMEQEPHIDSNQELGGDGDADDHPFKRARKSEVWNDMERPIKINGEWKTQCKHCKSRYTVSKSGTTSHIKRHLSNCAQRKLKLKQQSMINFLPSDSSAGKPNSGGVSALHNGKLDMLSMREEIANWIVMHEKPFSVVEEEGFNMMLKRGIPQWTSVSRHTIKTDAFKVYEAEKKKLKALLKDVDRISLTTDLWRARPQRIEYMVLTGHFIDRDWKLQKRVLTFVHIPPPRKGKDIANCIFKCLKEWDIENKEVFSRLALEDNDYVYCPSSDDWQKIEKLLDILKVFYDTTNVISGSEYPTSNFFLSEVFYIKEMLDKNYCSPDPFVKDMVKNMKERFDKYWGECNLLMAIGGVLDPRLKMKVVEITFPHMFPSNLVRENINKVKDTLYELYDEYKALYPPLEEHHGESRSGAPLVVQGGSLPGMSRVLQVVRSGIRVEPRKSELDVYLEECTTTDEGHRFDALNWWKERASKFVVLSRLAADVLAIPITTVASEATFSAGSRVIDPYRSSLLPETVQMLICTGDWCRSTFGIKRKNKKAVTVKLIKNPKQKSLYQTLAKAVGQDLHVSTAESAQVVHAQYKHLGKKVPSTTPFKKMFNTSEKGLLATPNNKGIVTQEPSLNVSIAALKNNVNAALVHGKGKGKLLVASPLLEYDPSSDDDGNATPLVSPFAEHLEADKAPGKIPRSDLSSPGPLKVFSTKEPVDPSQYMPLNCGVDQFLLLEMRFLMLLP
ncbi:hypothetical protein BVRB_6g143000 [Beta vulgaris subsp. vulgaris]|nr:hypothetical protein BVRB_6g143000 [Beta vulgaris subsp. vulgaris]